MPQSRLIVDRIACDGAGVCGHLAPSIISLDPWGYPVISDGLDIVQMRRAVKGCPRKALHLVEDARTRPTAAASRPSASPR